MFRGKLHALVYDILPSTTAVFSYAIGPRKLSSNEQVFVGAQTVVRLLQTTQIKQGVSFTAANKVYMSTNKSTIVWNETALFLNRGGCVSCLRACLGNRLLPQFYQYPNLSGGADRVGGQLRGDKECPFSGVTKSGRVWSQVLGVWFCGPPLPQSANEIGTIALCPGSPSLKSTRFLFPIRSAWDTTWIRKG